MRLTVLDRGHRVRAKLFLTLTGAMARVESPDIVKMMLYRPGFLGRPLLELTAGAMRGPSYWTAGEREYLAMCTARLLECPFCVDTHTELIRIASDGAIDPLDPSATTRPEVRAARDFLAGLTREDADAAGLPEDAVREALRVAVAFHVVCRLANAFGFTLREGQLKSGTESLHRFGYRFPGFLLAEGPEAARGDAVDDLRRTVLDAPAVTGPALRRAAAAGEELPEPWAPYAELVRDASYKITDADVDRLVEAGRSEDEVFELTVAVAVGAALRVFAAGTAALNPPADGAAGDVPSSQRDDGDE